METSLSHNRIRNSEYLTAFLRGDSSLHRLHDIDCYINFSVSEVNVFQSFDLGIARKLVNWNQ